MNALLIVVLEPKDFWHFF